MMNHREIIIQNNSSHDDFSLMSSRLQVVIIVNELHKHTNNKLLHFFCVVD